MVEFRCPMNDGGITKAFSSSHWGVDYGYVKTPYAPVMAIAYGEVVDNFYSDSCGYSIVIKHPVENGKHRFCTFIHLKEKSDLKIGAKVNQGDIVGIRGNTGKSNGVHLHFGLTSETTKEYTWNLVKILAIDPQPLMKKMPGVDYAGVMFNDMPELTINDDEAYAKALEDKISKLNKELADKNTRINKLEAIIKNIKELTNGI